MALLGVSRLRVSADPQVLPVPVFLYKNQHQFLQNERGRVGGMVWTDKQQEKGN